MHLSECSKSLFRFFFLQSIDLPVYTGRAWFTFKNYDQRKYKKSLRPWQDADKMIVEHDKKAATFCLPVINRRTHFLFLWMTAHMSFKVQLALKRLLTTFVLLCFPEFIWLLTVTDNIQLWFFFLKIVMMNFMLKRVIIGTRLPLGVVPLLIRTWSDFWAWDQLKRKRQK